MYIFSWPVAVRPRRSRNESLHSGSKSKLIAVYSCLQRRDKLANTWELCRWGLKRRKSTCGWRISYRHWRGALGAINALSDITVHWVVCLFHQCVAFGKLFLSCSCIDWNPLWAHDTSMVLLYYRRCLQWAHCIENLFLRFSSCSSFLLLG